VTDIQNYHKVTGMQQVWLTVGLCIWSHNRPDKGKRKDLEQWVRSREGQP